MDPNTLYDTIEPCSISNSLHKFVEICEEKGIKMYCVSGMKFSFHLKAKEYFVHKYYSENIEVISSRSQEFKCDAVKIIQRVSKCKLSEILFIDDIKENVIRFSNVGIYGLLPEEIEQLI